MRPIFEHKLCCRFETILLSCNLLINYADDSTLIVVEHCAADIADEMENKQKGSREN
jgi:hypothetical protein